ncbi:MAG TPA: CocE/NonD family hydrolase [Chloroflexota bacterium]
MSETILIEKNVMVAMRDGTSLGTDIYRPRTEAALPVILQRTPYDKDSSSIADLVRMARAGYCVVNQDVRGRFASAGDFTPFVHEADDGADAIAWAADQPWSTGKVGTIGASYVGATQWLAAGQTPPALHAMAPYITASDYYDGWTYRGGALELGFTLSWALGFALTETLRRIERGDATGEDRERMLDAVAALDTHYKHLPLADLPIPGPLAPYFATWLEHPDDDSYWQCLAPNRRYERVTAPALNMGGWYDIFLGGTLANYQGMKARGGSEAARIGQRLLIGPWAHGLDKGWFPSLDFGPRAGASAVTVDLTGEQIRWFDYLLKGIENGLRNESPVRLFIMGTNVWRDESDWPLPDTHYRAYYLHSMGGANSMNGDGRLSLELPVDEASDVYLYDPHRPVPTCGGASLLPGMAVGANGGPLDQRLVEMRHDVLCYTTAPLERPLEVTGPVTLTLYVSSSARDTDFTGKLVDVAPGGRATILTDGILRARYRDSFEHQTLLEPGSVYELRIDLWATANVFAAGHRIRLEVSSSNFPRFGRNTNTGGVIAADHAGEMVQAVNRVWHDRQRPSHLMLPIIERT